jgi:hypothetical protein
VAFKRTTPGDQHTWKRQLNHIILDYIILHLVLYHIVLVIFYFIATYVGHAFRPTPIQLDIGSLRHFYKYRGRGLAGSYFLNIQSTFNEHLVNIL